VQPKSLFLSMSGSAQPDPAPPFENEAGGALSPVAAESHGQAFDENDLQAALQLLVERAQYITGATGAALALADGDDMVCRASVGRCAPAVGARLQVRSGLTGESISRKQLLRCDNAEADPRVNLEACRELGIASIVVMPLLTRAGEARGLFELFSDHPNAFEERDLNALERMAELTKTSLDLAARPLIVPSSAVRRNETLAAAPAARPKPALTSATEGSKPPASGVSPSLTSIPALDEILRGPGAPVVAPETSTTPLPEAMRKIQKCAACGFPVSEGRTFCLDCEKKPADQVGTKFEAPTASQPMTPLVPEPDGGLDAVGSGEPVPDFLANAAPHKESWLADHVNLLAIAVLILCILVALVVFR
jgi:putative methionine-R-sulfoxide reductase with GAF domain